MDNLGRADGTSPNEIRTARKVERRQKPTLLRSDSLTMAALNCHPTIAVRAPTAPKPKHGIPRGMHMAEVLRILIRDQNYRCGICRQQMREPLLCNVHRIVAKADGGTFNWSNLQATHIVCNQVAAVAVGERAASRPKQEMAEELYLCPVCDRDGLKDASMFWGHVRHQHSPLQLIVALRKIEPSAPNCDALLDAAESALIRIVNSLDHESAIEIATAALCGKMEDES